MHCLGESWVAHRRALQGGVLARCPTRAPRRPADGWRTLACGPGSFRPHPVTCSRRKADALTSGQRQNPGAGTVDSGKAIGGRLVSGGEPARYVPGRPAVLASAVQFAPAPARLPIWLPVNRVAVRNVRRRLPFPRRQSPFAAPCACSFLAFCFGTLTVWPFTQSVTFFRWFLASVLPGRPVSGRLGPARSPGRCGVIFRKKRFETDEPCVRCP